MEKDDEDDIRRYFEYAKTCGMPLMVIGTTHQALARIEKFVKEYGIPVAIHNHGPEDKNFPSPQVALKAIQGHGPAGRAYASMSAIPRGQASARWSRFRRRAPACSTCTSRTCAT